MNLFLPGDVHRAKRPDRSGRRHRERAGCQDGGVDVLSSRILVRPADPGRSRHFYRDLLGLAVYREFGSPADPGVVFFLGSGFLEVSGRAAGPPGQSVMIWLQVRDVHAEHERLAAAGVRVLREPADEPWGLTEMWIEDPDGVRIVLVEIPADHPLRRDQRGVSPAARAPGA
jgi:catechol 2,3-dioxygenase-like lactoylglutathione lyase family enzyme